MKRIIFLALVIMASATFNLANAQDKKSKKKKKKGEVTAVVNTPVFTAEPVDLVSDVDSLSYAVGLVNGGDLLKFLNGQGVDTTYVNDIKRGFIDASNIKPNSPEAAYFFGAHLFLDFSNRINENLFVGDSTYHVSTKHLLAGVFDGVDHNYSKMSLNDIKPKIDDMAGRMHNKIMMEKYGKNIQEGKDFLELNAKAPGVKVLPSGLQYKVLREGTGPVATASDQVTVHYEGKLLNGKVFDSSYERGEPTKFRPTQVIKGWTEALTMMPEGSMWELYIPENLAYGDRKAGDIPPYSTLIFKVEVIKVEAGSTPPAPNPTPVQKSTTTTSPKKNGQPVKKQLK